MHPPRPTGTPDDAYLSVRALAQYSGLSVRTLRTYLAAADPLPHFKLRGKILVKRSEFDTWLLRFRVVRDDAAFAATVDDILQAVR